MRETPEYGANAFSMPRVVVDRAGWRDGDLRHGDVIRLHHDPPVASMPSRAHAPLLPERAPSRRHAVASRHDA